MTLLEMNDLREDPQFVSSLEVAFASADKSVLQSVYEVHSSFVYSLCRRSVDDAAAADITQEVFIAAWRNRRRYDPSRGGLRAWLATITRNKLIDHYRSNGREDRRIERAKDTYQPQDPAAVELETIARRMLLADAMDGLPERARHMISLAFFEDMTHVEIANKTGVPLGTVKSDIRRGLDRLRRELGDAND